MTLVELWPFQEYDNLFGMIVPCSTGIKWTNQVGGVACCHPEIEGIFVPLPASWKPSDDPLYDYYHGYDKSLVQNFIDSKPELRTWFKTLDEDPKDPLLDSMEAWVPVVVKKPVEKSPGVWYDNYMGPFIGKTVILTYPNSD